ncbi:MAG: hypothetical protein VYB54_09485 [Pseudomonadota bacterium]|nr:hypothetical protein [Pseudomonadota bacterium]
MAERLLAGDPFDESQNDYDWLGWGRYFWESDPGRALQFARESRDRRRRGGAAGEPEGKPAVVGAVIDPGLCFDLTTVRATRMLAEAHARLVPTFAAIGIDPPQNRGGLHRLDCAVINMFHQLRADIGDPPVDTVRGIFPEGGAAFDGSGLSRLTHTQICVRNPDAIIGVFRVSDRLMQPA